MVKYILPLLLVVLLQSTGAFAQNKEESAVAAAVENLKKAMIDADSSALAGMVLDELSYGHSSGKIESKASFVGSLASGKSDFLNMDLTDQTIRVVNHTAIVRHTLSAQIIDNGNAATVKLLVLLVWVKDKGRWKLLARQAVRSA